MNDTLIGNYNNTFNYENNNNSQIYPEIGSPSVGPYISPTFNQNLSYNDQIYGTMVCYNCLSVLLIRHDWNYTRCGECQKINKVPHRSSTNTIPNNNNMIYNNNINNFYENSQDNDFLGDVPYVYGVVNCPFCTTENKIRKESKRVTCYNCANSFSVNGYSSMKKQKNVSRSLPKIIKYREFVPIYQNNDCNCNNNSAQLFMLSKILDELKQKKKPLIAYPTLFHDPFGFYYRDLIGNNRYVDDEIKIRRPLSISKPTINKENDSNGFKITIRKKNKDENENTENKLSKSAALEKVFFTNRLNDGNNKGAEFEL